MSDMKCPICELNLHWLPIRKREEHCDQCLDQVDSHEHAVSVATDHDESQLISAKEIRSVGESTDLSIVRSSIPEDSNQPSNDLPDTHISGSKEPTDKSNEASSKNKKLKREYFGLVNAEIKIESTGISEGAEKTEQKYTRPMPFYKILTFGKTKIAVDAFNYGAIPQVTSYFLTHFHSDHYGGLSKKWTHGPVYCSPSTARLVALKLRVLPDYIKPLDMDVVHRIDNIEVMLFDANHCPGAVVFLFDKHVLHTGDFRATEDLVKQIGNCTQSLDTVYLDTTYLDPQRKFPSQDLVVAVCSEFCAKIQAKPVPRSWFTTTPEKRKILVIVGSYTIGKEKLAITIARSLKSKIWCPPWKRKVFEAIDSPEINEILTDDAFSAQVHLASMRDLSVAKLETTWKVLKKHFTQLIAFVPTGWTWPANGVDFTLQTLEESKTTIVKNGGLLRICKVPYSEHSSYSELERFCTAVQCEKLIATVPTKNYNILRQWQKSGNH